NSKYSFVFSAVYLTGGTSDERICSVFVLSEIICAVSAGSAAWRIQGIVCRAAGTGPFLCFGKLGARLAAEILCLLPGILFSANKIKQ
ncbi:MAG: hypothetical protein ACI4J5_03180, partial [Oscillospiraceae bacterium]